MGSKGVQDTMEGRSGKWIVLGSGYRSSRAGEMGCVEVGMGDRVAELAACVEADAGGCGVLHRQVGLGHASCSALPRTIAASYGLFSAQPCGALLSSGCGRLQARRFSRTTKGTDRSTRAWLFWMTSIRRS